MTLRELIENRIERVKSLNQGVPKDNFAYHIHQGKIEAYTDLLEILSDKKFEILNLDVIKETKPITPLKAFNDLLTAFSLDAVAKHLLVDVSPLEEYNIRMLVGKFNFKNNTNFKVKIYSDDEVMVSKSLEIPPKKLRNWIHKYTLGEKYPYTPASPTSGSNAIKMEWSIESKKDKKQHKTAGELAWEQAMQEMKNICCESKDVGTSNNHSYADSIIEEAEKTVHKILDQYPQVVGYYNIPPKDIKKSAGTETPDPYCNYHFTYKYSNVEKHDEPTPPWYKQHIDICNELMKLVKDKLNNFIDSDDANIYVQYQNNTFVIEIYVNKIQSSLKSKIDNAIAIPVLAVHRWGGLYLTYAEIKENI